MTRFMTRAPWSDALEQGRTFPGPGGSAAERSGAPTGRSCRTPHCCPLLKRCGRVHQPIAARDTDSRNDCPCAGSHTATAGCLAGSGLRRLAGPFPPGGSRALSGTIQRLASGTANRPISRRRITGRRAWTGVAGGAGVGQPGDHDQNCPHVYDGRAEERQAHGQAAS